MVKDYIKTIIRQDRALSDQWHVYKDSIRNDLTGQEIDVYPYKEAALQGKHFHVLVGDEIHVWRDEYVWNAAVSGQAKIPNALTIGITTAGRSRDGFLFGLYQKLKRDPYAFVCWLGITDQDDPEDRACWRKVTAAGRVTMEELKARGCWLVGADMDGVDFYAANMTGPIVLVIGAEGKGLGRLVKQKCDDIVSIPMHGGVNSLNASNAGAILMYEVVRQRHFFGGQ